MWFFGFTGSRCRRCNYRRYGGAKSKFGKFVHFRFGFYDYAKVINFSKIFHGRLFVIKKIVIFAGYI